MQNLIRMRGQRGAASALAPYLLIVPVPEVHHVKATVYIHTNRLPSRCSWRGFGDSSQLCFSCASSMLHRVQQRFSGFKASARIKYLQINTNIMKKISRIKGHSRLHHPNLGTNARTHKLARMMRSKDILQACWTLCGADRMSTSYKCLELTQ